MAKLRYTGELGQVRRDDRALRPDEILEVPDHEVDGHVALGLFSLVETSAQTPNPSPAVSAADETKE